MVKGVLAIKTAEKRDRREVQHVPMEEELHETVDRTDRDESHYTLPEGRQELISPHARGEEPQGGQQPCQSEDDRQGEERK
jgi:hypothetical protein